MRRIRLSDEEPLRRMLERMSGDDLRRRCLGTVKDFPRHAAERFVQADGGDELALVAVATGAETEILGVAHLSRLRGDQAAAEYDVMVRSDQQGHGLGHRLTEAALDEAAASGLRKVLAEVSADNHAMLRMAFDFGFRPVIRDGNLVQIGVEIPSAVAAPPVSA